MASPKIVLVEDNESVKKIIEFKLKNGPYEFHHYENGIDGLEAIKELKPDLVVLDVMLPGLNGFEILRQLRDYEGTANTKVIMLTSKNREEDVAKGFEYGVEEYISKPFRIGEFMMRLNRALS